MTQAISETSAIIDEGAHTSGAGDFLPTVAELAEQYPLGEFAPRVQQHRQAVNGVLAGADSRLLVVVGPCSLHDSHSALEYGARLAALQQKVQDRLLLVMRAYVEKPRTTVGWKGLVYDPHLDGRNDMADGLRRARELLLGLVQLGLPLATESLNPLVTDYLQDMLSWTAIGARTTESQLHRELASGLPCAAGFKNGTDGGVDAALQAMQAARAPHAFPGLSHCGRPQLRRTPGNSHVHLILRGGKAPNYDEASVNRYSAALAQKGLPPRLMVDCSHGNSGKDYRRQATVVAELARQLQTGHSPVMGVMLESHLQEGRQSVQPGKPLAPGISITDGCIGWDETQRLCEMLYEVCGF